MNRPRLHHRHSGFTLVELMVAILIGLIIMVVIGQVYLSGRQSYRSQTGFGGMQENARFALYFLQRDIRMAGFPRAQAPGAGLPPASGLQAIEATDDQPGSDRIQIQYTSFGETSSVTEIPPGALNDAVLGNLNFDDSAATCLGDTGGPITAPINVTNEYFVNVDGELQCIGMNDNGVDQSQPILSGVESMQILYGVDLQSLALDADGNVINGPADGYADVFLRGDQVTAAQWNQVVAVRIGLLINSAPEQIFDTPDDGIYAVLDELVDAATDIPEANRRFARRVVTTTIQLRNRSDL